MSFLNFSHLTYISFDRFSTSSTIKLINLQCPLAYQKACGFNTIPLKFNAKLKSLKSIRASENSPPETPVPATHLASSWKNWMISIILSIILPSFRHKWGPLLAFKSKVDMTVETVESVTEAVEDLAEEVEKVANEVANKLPDDTNLKEAVELVGNQAGKLEKKAEQIEELVHQVEEVENSLMSEVMEPNKNSPKEY